MLGVFREISGGVHGYENVREQSFDARVSRFGDDGIGQRVARRHEAIAQIARPRAALAYRNASPKELRRTRSSDDLREPRRGRLLKISKRLASRGIYRRKSIDGDGSRGHKSILSEKILGAAALPRAKPAGVTSRAQSARSRCPPPSGRPAT